MRGLGVIGMPGVHGMSHLVCYGGDTVQRSREIGQDIGVGIVSTGAEGPAALTAVGIDIYPAGRKTLTDNFPIVLSQRRDRIQYHLLRLLIGVFSAAAACERSIEIIIVELVQRQQLFPKFRITVHGRKVGPHCLDQCIIHLHRNILSRH